MDDSEIYRRAGELFDAAVELPPDDREAFLAKAGESDAKAAALARKLLAKDRPARLMDFTIDEPPTDDPAEILGAFIGPYKVESLIARGGMGAVYLARREDPVASVAIKFITLVAAPAGAVDRFQRETEWLAAVDHPGVVRYRSSGVDQRGRPYLIMDFVDGERLSHTVEDIAASVPRTVELIIDAAAAVQHLHQRGILHRDLKPSNILLTRRDGKLAPVVVDLGIARALDPDDATLTSATGPIGTPGYMSPEQWSGSRTPDVRMDVYSLGAVLFALLTGRNPAKESRDSEGLPREGNFLSKAPSKAVDPAEFPSAQTRSRQIAGDLDAIVAKALEPEADRRYGSVEAFADDLGRWVAGLPVQAHLPGPVGRLAKLVRRRPFESILVAGSAIALITTTVVTRQSLAKERETRAQYEEQLKITEGALDFFSEEVIQTALPQRLGPDAPIVDALHSAVSALRDPDAERPEELVLSVSTVLQGVLSALDMAEEGETLLPVAEPLEEERAELDSIRLQSELQSAVTLLNNEGTGTAGQDALIELWERIQGADPFELPEGFVASLCQAMAVSLEIAGEYDESLMWIQRGLDDPFTKESERVEVMLLYARGTTERVSGDVRKAAETFEPLVDRFLGFEGERSPGAQGTSTHLAAIYLGLGEHDKALPYARKSFEIADLMLPAAHENRLIALSTLAACAHGAGDYDLAIDSGEEVSRLCRTRYGEESVEVYGELSKLIENYLLAGRGDEAADHAMEAFSGLEAMHGIEHPDTLRAMINLARTELASDNSDEALGLAELAIETLEGLDAPRYLMQRAVETRDEALQAEAND